MSNNLHKLLKRQLQRAGIDSDQQSENVDLEKFIAMVNSSYDQNDKERYILERSLLLSSSEMKALNSKVKKRAEEWIQEISNAYPDILLFIDIQGNIIDLLPRSGFDSIIQPKAKLEFAKEIGQVFIHDLVDIIREHISKLKNTQKNQSFEFNINQQVFEIRLIIKSSTNNDSCFCLIRDITDLSQSKEKLKHLALHDSLTGLPNRLYFYKKLKSILDPKIYKQQTGAVLFFDLDRFKSVNDTLGHKVGDLLIEGVAKRVHKIINDNEFFVRISGDEFIIIVSEMDSESDYNDCTKRVLQCFSKPYVINNQIIEVKSSIGVSVFPTHSADPDELIQFADTAMYTAKENGGNQVAVFDKQQHSSVSRNFLIEQNMRRGIEREEFFIKYQPIINVQNNKIIAYESLLRWNISPGKQLSPDVFIPIAEATGYIIELGHWIIDTVLKQVKLWKDNHFNFNSVSINLSRVQLIDPTIANYIVDKMDFYGITEREINIEVTENSIISNSNTALKNLNILSKKGVDIAIDDFGTGYSSFYDLKNLPFTWMKIDKCLIQGIGKDDSEDAIVRAITAIAKELNLNVVAEGVETKAQKDFLIELNCFNLQGFYFAKPEPAEYFLEKNSNQTSTD